MRKLSSVMSIILAVCLTIGGVSAAWVYATGAPKDPAPLSTGVTGNYPDTYVVKFINEKTTLYTIKKTFGQDVTNAELYGYEQTFDPDKPSTEQANPIAAILAQMKELGYADNVTFKYWMYSGSAKVESIENNERYIIELFPSFANRYTAMFVDQNANVLHWEFFDAGATSLTQTPTAPTIDGFSFDHWEIRGPVNGTETPLEYTGENLAKYTGDITIYPIYTYNGAAALTPVDTDGDGVTNYYQVDGYSNGSGSKLVEIPDEVNGVPVEIINTDAFAGFDDLTAVKIPDSLTSIGSNAFEDGPNQYITTSGRSTITIYYDGSPDTWKQYMDVFYQSNSKYTSYNSLGTYENPTTILKSGWDSGLGDGSRIFFLGDDGNVDPDAGYWELYHERSGLTTHYYTWIFHDHEYLETPPSNCGKNHFSGNYTDYDAEDRVDRNYWITDDDVVSSEETTE